MQRPPPRSLQGRPAAGSAEAGPRAGAPGRARPLLGGPPKGWVTAWNGHRLQGLLELVLQGLVGVRLHCCAAVPPQ